MQVQQVCDWVSTTAAEAVTALVTSTEAVAALVVCPPSPFPPAVALCAQPVAALLEVEAVEALHLPPVSALLHAVEPVEAAEPIVP